MKFAIFTICMLTLNSCYFFREDSVDSVSDKITPSGVIGGTFVSACGADSAELSQNTRSRLRRASSSVVQRHLQSTFSQFRPKTLLSLGHWST